MLVSFPVALGVASMVEQRGKLYSSRVKSKYTYICPVNLLLLREDYVWSTHELDVFSRPVSPRCAWRGCDSSHITDATGYLKDAFNTSASTRAAQQNHMQRWCSQTHVVLWLQSRNHFIHDLREQTQAEDLVVVSAGRWTLMATWVCGTWSALRLTSDKEEEHKTRPAMTEHPSRRPL